MIRTIQPITYKKVNRIAPSQFYSTLQCPYKMVLAEAFGYKSLIALPPNAYSGSVIHRLIELITKRVIIDLDTFQQYWDDGFKKKDEELIAEGLRGLTPLKRQVKDIGIKKIQLQKLINTKATVPNTERYYPLFQSEVPLHDLTGKIYGKADMVYEGPDRVEIYDFKTGSILKQELDENGDTRYLIKEEYEYQLKLYAYLYFLMNGKLPDKLYLVTLDKKKTEIPFTMAECEYLYSKAIETLESLNSSLAAGHFEVLAKYSKTNCVFCMYRPACSYYNKTIDGNMTEINDVSGILQSFKVFPNGNACAYLKTSSGTRIVPGFNQSDEYSFNQNLRKKLAFYNIKKDKNAVSLTATKFTTIYAY